MNVQSPTYSPEPLPQKWWVHDGRTCSRSTGNPAHGRGCGKLKTWLRIPLRGCNKRRAWEKAGKGYPGTVEWWWAFKVTEGPQVRFYSVCTSLMPLHNIKRSYCMTNTWLTEVSKLKRPPWLPRCYWYLFLKKIILIYVYLTSKSSHKQHLLPSLFAFSSSTFFQIIKSR